MAFLNTISQQPNPEGQPDQERVAALHEHKKAIEKECRALARLTLPNLSARLGSSTTERRLPVRKLAEIDRQLEQHELDKTRLQLISETPKLALLPSPSHQPGPTPEPTKTQPQGKFSVKSILSAPWSTEDTTPTTIATHLDALHRAAAHTATREAT